MYHQIKESSWDLKKASKDAENSVAYAMKTSEGEPFMAPLRRAQTEFTEDKAYHFTKLPKNAILNAIEHPRNINVNLVNAQQARRVLDRHRWL